MKPSPLNRPLILLPVTAVAVAWLAHTGWKLHSENNALQAALAAAPPSHEKKSAGEISPHTAPTKDGAETQDRLAELREQLASETASRIAAEAKAAELAAILPTKEGDIVVSFGRVEQMGQASAKFVSLIYRLLGNNVDGGNDRAPEDQQQMTEASLKHLAQIPELQGMEDNAGEISRFHAATLKEVFGLDAASANKAAKFLEAEFARLKSDGLTVSQRPEADKPAWEKRRDDAMKDLASRMEAMLPANHPQLNLLPGLLSLGEGFRTTVQMNEDGHGSMNMGLPLFPSPPPH